MRGEDERSGSLFSYVDLEGRIDRDHPLRMIRLIVNEALAALAGDFSALYLRIGRPLFQPERLLRAMLLQAFYSIRSERQLMELLEFDLLFRWFVGTGQPLHARLRQNRAQQLGGDVAFQQPIAVFGKCRVIPRRVLDPQHGPIPE